MQIRDKVVVITGGASGLGLATARYLVEEKHAKVAILDLNDEDGQRAASDLGGRALYVRVDVVSEDSVRSALEAVTLHFGAIDICINCAAILGPMKLLDKEGKAAPLANFSQVVRVNLVGLFNVMSQCAERMAKNDPEDGEERGVVINISSVSAYEGQIGQCAYAASKAGVIGISLPAARELGAIGIRVNAIAPGLFLTRMAEALDEKVFKALQSQIEAPRRMGDMREFAHCCAFVIENSYLNAETIRLDAASRLRAR